MPNTEQFAHVFYSDDRSDEEIIKVKKQLFQIDAQRHFAAAILAELEGATSPSLAMLWWKAKDAYQEALASLADLDPFAGEQEKAKWHHARNNALRYRDMVHWLYEQAEIHRKAEEIDRDERVAEMRERIEADERPTE